MKAKLKDWTSRRVAGSFNMVEGVMYLRKSVTAYTVQHEMFHMKLWYKMTKEFPKAFREYLFLAGDFNNFAFDDFGEGLDELQNMAKDHLERTGQKMDKPFCFQGL